VGAVVCPKASGIEAVYCPQYCEHWNDAEAVVLTALPTFAELLPTVAPPFPPPPGSRTGHGGLVNPGHGQDVAAHRRGHGESPDNAGTAHTIHRVRTDLRIERRVGLRDGRGHGDVVPHRRGDGHALRGEPVAHRRGLRSGRRELLLVLSGRQEVVVVGIVRIGHGRRGGRQTGLRRQVHPQGELLGGIERRGGRAFGEQESLVRAGQRDTRGRVRHGRRHRDHTQRQHRHDGGEHGGPPPRILDSHADLHAPTPRRLRSDPSQNCHSIPERGISHSAINRPGISHPGN
jgi:hypothetical protein